MKRILLFILLFPITIEASTIQEKVFEVTPDSPFYQLDLFVEETKLLFISKNKESSLLFEILNERLDEALLFEKEGKIDKLDRLAVRINKRIADLINVSYFNNSELNKDEIEQFILMSDKVEVFLSDEIREEFVNLKELMVLYPYVIEQRNSDEILFMRREAIDVVGFMDYKLFSAYKEVDLSTVRHTSYDSVLKEYGEINEHVRKHALLQCLEQIDEQFQNPSHDNQMSLTTLSNQLDFIKLRIHKHELDFSLFTSIKRLNNLYYEKNDAYYEELLAIHEVYSKEFVKMMVGE